MCFMCQPRPVLEKECLPGLQIEQWKMVCGFEVGEALPSLLKLLSVVSVVYRHTRNSVTSPNTHDVVLAHVTLELLLCKQKT